MVVWLTVFEAGEAVGDLGSELGFGGFVGLVGVRCDFDAVFLGDAGDVGAGGVGVGGDGDGADEAEVDDVAGEDGVVAVAEGEEDVGLGEHAGLMISAARRCSSDGETHHPVKCAQSLLFRDFRLGLRWLSGG